MLPLQPIVAVSRLDVREKGKGNERETRARTKGRRRRGTRSILYCMTVTFIYILYQKNVFSAQFSTLISKQGGNTT